METHEGSGDDKKVKERSFLPQNLIFYPNIFANKGLHHQVVKKRD